MIDLIQTALLIGLVLFSALAILVKDLLKAAVSLAVASLLLGIVFFRLGAPYAGVFENVGYQLNRPDPAAAMMEGWKNSPGHRKNMLLAEVAELGVGAAPGKSGRWYFVQVLGQPQQPPRKQALREVRSAGSI